MSNTTKPKRGRPVKPLNYPKGKFTVNTLVALNPDITCRLSLYTKVGQLVKSGKLRFTGKFIKTGGVGKPLNEIQTLASFRSVRNRKRNLKAKSLKPLATAAPVVLNETVTATTLETVTA